MNIRKYLPQSVKRPLRRLYNDFLDRVDQITGKSEPFTPPRNVSIVGKQCYRAIGEEILKHLIEIGGLQPEDQVLEVGSGNGRIALPLTSYLSSGNAYWGIEIHHRAVKWCQKTITAAFPGFQFLHADIYNGMYNPSGRIRSSEYRFPFPGSSFDFACAISVFTHMFPQDVEHYLTEISRVLRPGGKCLATFFLLNSEARRGISEGQSSEPFIIPGPGYMTKCRELPESAIAFDEKTIRRMLENFGLILIDPIYLGSWSGREYCKSYQDLVLFSRP